MATVATSSTSNGSCNSKLEAMSINSETSPNLLDQDGVLDIDSLKQFTIPKKSKSKKETFESVSLDSHQYQNDILHVIQHSYRDRDSVQHFVYSNPRLVHNGNLLQEFLKKKKCMKQDGYGEKELQELYGFACYNTQFEARRACEPGITVGNKLSVNCLGNPKMGVYLSKNADVIFNDLPNPRQRGTLVIFKVIKGRVKLFRDGNGGESLEPTPNFDCHQMKVATSADITGILQFTSFQNSQIYVYEYTEDSDLADRPRQICPFAVVDFCYNGPVKDDVRSRPAPKPPIPMSGNKKTENIDPVLNNGHARVPPIQKPPLAKIPRLLPSTDVSSNLDASSFGGTGYFPPPRRAAANRVIAKPTSRMPAASLTVKPDVSLQCKQSDTLPPVMSKRSTDSQFVGTVESKRSADVLSVGTVETSRNADDPSVVAVESNRSADSRCLSNAISSASAEDTSDLTTNAEKNGDRIVADDSKVLQTLQESVVISQKYVVWSGRIAVNGTDICDAEIKSFMPIDVQQWDMGSSLNLSNKLLTSSARTRYLQQLSSVSKTKEQTSGEYRLRYARLRPTSGNFSQFARFIVYLVKSQCAAFVEYPNQRSILLLTDFCDIVKDFDLADDSEVDKVFLHIFFVSLNNSDAETDKDHRLSPTESVISSTVSPSEAPVAPLTVPSNSAKAVSDRDPRVWSR